VVQSAHAEWEPRPLRDPGSFIGTPEVIDAAPELVTTTQDLPSEATSGDLCVTSRPQAACHRPQVVCRRELTGLAGGSSARTAPLPGHNLHAGMLPTTLLPLLRRSRKQASLAVWPNPLIA
jgi:hypothetical protein